MNIYTNSNSAFPSQVVSDAEKASWEVMLKKQVGNMAVKLLWLLNTSGLDLEELTVTDI